MTNTINVNSKSDFSNIYDPVNKHLPIEEHYAAYPYHPWNKWILNSRSDENLYEEVYDENAKEICRFWRTVNGDEHRIGAPAYVVYDVDNYKIKYEQWFVKRFYHRVDGPAVRDNYDNNSWILFNQRMNKEQHEEIVSMYSELGDWMLSFSLSNFAVTNENYLEKAIKEVTMLG